MYCQSCGKKNNKIGNFCASCGSKITPPATQENHTSTQSDSFNLDVKNPSQGWWKMDEKTYQEQVINYYDLKITKSFRGISSLLLLFSSGVTLLLIFFGIWSFEFLIDVVLVILLAFFIYKGHKWAIVLAAIYWTYSKVYLMSNFDEPSISPVVQLIWWGVYIRAFWAALKVEKARSLRAQI